MKKAVLIISILCSFNLFSQKNTLDKVISNVNNSNSFTINFAGYTNKTSIHFNKECLVLFKDKKSKKEIEKIVSNINRDNVISIHLILTKILNPNKLDELSLLGIYDIEDIDNGQIVMIKYVINKLVFIEDLIEERYIISKNSVEKIKEYWFSQILLEFSSDSKQ